MAAPRGRDSQCTGSATQGSVYYGLPCLNLADNSQLSQDDRALNPEYLDNAYTSMLLSSLDPSEQFGEKDAITTAFTFESFPAHGNSPSPLDQLSQGDQLDPGGSPSPITSALLANIENKESTSTPSVPTNSGRAHRGLPRRKSRYLIHETDRRATATFMPPNSGPADPLERWKNSPPEAEAASLSAIQNALENQSIYSGGNQGLAPGPCVEDLFQTHRCAASRAASTASGESATSASSRPSSRSRLSFLSNGSQNPSDKTSGGVQKKQPSTSRKKRRPVNNARIFCCTFCCDKFKNKYDWMRHEKSLHLNLENWACAPFGGSVVLPSTCRAHCAYCNQLDPNPIHLEQHNHGPCQQQMRTFRRKDHLFQHLRLFHRLDTMPLIDSWKSVVTDFSSRCGFCDSRMSNWDERADHLTVHFRQGCTMAHWKGDHEFPPEIAAQVRHSVPPYLLDFESRTLVPFSATNGAVNDHLSQMLTRASFLNATGEPQMLPESEALEVELQPAAEPQLDSYTEVLTRHLSHYAQQMMSSGIIPTDEMFQVEARRLLFDSEDQWNQTLADNLEWLAKFRGEQSG
ncbi:uncharacterized protein BDV17DRAFT_301323 [Aspergillus undulatus]|uniref:uncharacterized protein n=1 Tax=Aspergillus undulatus TaxID=1810928 RepID=UPI003CCD03E6